mmetsp:Transcript_23640/g.55997  ORF Transcript_23640/g.55997 Transcript_23640/m.55997 type:complete len:495 (+) Transcript_23640:97-1581(+)
MGEVDFEMSSQAKCWMFNEETLRQCREACNSFPSNSKTKSGKPRVRKFACGYHGRTTESTATRNIRDKPHATALSSTISPEDQEILIHFHAHQIQKLIGPNAIFPVLKRGASVLSTAIMLFRKFYLSNSVINFHPRHIATASALLAVKTDCERNLPIDVLSHATLVVEMRASNDPLSMDELRAVSIQEIEVAERALLEGCDYRLRSHHPYGAIKVLASDVTSYFMKPQQRRFVPKTLCLTENVNVHASPRSVACDAVTQPQYLDGHSGLDSLCERALSIAQSALVYSDVNFLFPPGQIAFATVALALDSHAYNNDDESPTCNRLGTMMREYMCARFSQKSAEELLEYEEEVSKIIASLENCSAIDLEMFTPFWQYHQRRYARTAEREAIKIRKAIFTASRLRVMSKATSLVVPASSVRSLSPPPFGYHTHHHVVHFHHYQHNYKHHHYNIDGGCRKRERDEVEETWTPKHQHHSHHLFHQNKIARVTPVNTPFL